MSGDITRETRLHSMPSTVNEEMKPNHVEFPCYVLENGTIYVNTFVRFGHTASDFISSIAEPISRPQYVHEYRLTSFSLLSAISDMEGDAGKILGALAMFSKHRIPDTVSEFIQFCVDAYCKVGITYSGKGVFLTSRYSDILIRMCKNETIRMAKMTGDALDPILKKRKTLVDAGNPSLFDNVGDFESDEMDGDPNIYMQIQPKLVGVVKNEAAKMDLPIIEEYDYRGDESLPNFEFSMNSRAQLRWYQKQALSMMFRTQKAKSGIIVLPCGAGKTLTGIAAACTIRKSTLVLCNNNLACSQWAAAFQQFTSASMDEDIFCFTSGGDAPPRFPTDRAFVLMATYSMMSMDEESRSTKASAMMERILGVEWGMLILDEVHIAPAKKFREAIHAVRTRCKMGLTATLVREDGQIGDLNYLVGPKIFEANWMKLTAQGYLARVMCYDVQCPMSVTSMIEYAKSHKDRDGQVFCYSSNTNKLAACEKIMKHHEALGDQILIFSDSIPILRYCAETMHRYMMYGSTPEHERIELFARFRSGNIRTLLISRVGDIAVDLPDANVIIQISAHFASRRQETQRLGRILRPKGDTIGPDGKLIYNAFFYSLVSPLTREAMYNVSRQKYLNDQGFTYSSVAWETLMRHKGDAHTLEEQAKILQTIRENKKPKKNQVPENSEKEIFPGDGV